MKLLFSFLVFSFLSSCKEPYEGVTPIIIEIPFMNERIEYNQGEIGFNKKVIIKNYNKNMHLDEMAYTYLCKQSEIDSSNYNSISIKYYKKSEKTNISYLQKFPESISTHSDNHDAIAAYTWKRDKPNLMKRNDFLDNIYRSTMLWVNCDAYEAYRKVNPTGTLLKVDY